MDKKGRSWRRDREEWRRPKQDEREFRDEKSSAPEKGKPREEKNVEVNKEQDETVILEADNAEEAEQQQKEREEEEKKWVEEFLKEDQRREETREKTRQKNINAAEFRPEESDFRKRDSALKKTTAFIRKVRNFTEQQYEPIAKEMKTLNLSKYMGEVASALVEAKLKLTDIPAAIELASQLHQTYADFAQQFQENWAKALAMKKEDKSVANLSKLRVDLRFYADAVSHGLLTLKAGLPLLGNVLMTLISMDKDSKTFSNISVLLSFCKHCGKDYAGLIPKRVRQLSSKYEVPISTVGFLPPEKQKNLRNLLKDYYSALAKHLVEGQKELNGFEKAMRKMLMTRGEVPKDRSEKGEAMKATQVKVLQNVQQLAEVLDEEIPALPAPTFDDDEESHVDIGGPSLDSIGGKEEGKDNLWDDEDTRSFYEDLVDLRVFVPSILYKDSEKATSKMPEPEEDNLDDDLLVQEALEAENAAAAGGDVVASKVETAGPGTDSEREGGGPAGDKSEEETISAAALAVLNDDGDDDAATVEDESTASAAASKTTKKGVAKTNLANKVLLDAYLTSLPQCISRELMDQAAIRFCMELNTKNNRRKLVRTLFSVPRTRQDLLPFYGRLVATLYPCMPDVANDLAHMLKQEFRFQLRKKDQINIETKVKVVRFIAELVKFRMYPKSEALFCFRMLLFEFRHHNIEMACNLLETCGRYLFRSPDSHPRMKLFLDQMMRKKTVQSLESRYETMVENAYYYVNPPDLPASAQEVEILPPEMLWIRYLIVEFLSSSTADKVVKCLRRIDWFDPEVREFAEKTLAEPSAIKFYHIRFLANVAQGVLGCQEEAALRIVDRVLEDIRLGLEINASKKFFQRRIAAVSYLGELYKVRLVDSTVIFNALYSFITFGVSPTGEWTPLDAPDNLFRIKLICQLLAVCGNFFVTGSAKKKLLCYMLYFQRYYWRKRDHEVWGENGSRFPVLMTFMVEDIFRDVTPQTPMAKSRQEAELAVEEMEKEICKQVETGLPEGVTLDSLFGDGSSGVGGEATGKEDDLDAILEEEDGEGGVQLEPSASMAKLRSSVRKAVENAVGGGEDSPKTHSLSEGPQDEDEVSAAVFDGDDEEEEEDGDFGGRDNESDLGEDGDDQNEGSSSSDENSEEEDYDDDDEKEKKTAYQLEDVETRVTDVKMSVIECPEDEDFVSGFDRLVSESVLERTKDVAKPSAVADITVPFHVKSGDNKRKTYEQLQQPQVHSSTMKFVLMTRRGNKQQFRDIEVPLDSDLAKNLKTREELDRAEKEHIKRVTLNINERQEEEDYQEMLQAAQRPATVCFHRERKPKFQHPKGAPDADAIFGPKRIVKFQ